MTVYAIGASETDAGNAAGTAEDKLLVVSSELVIRVADIVIVAAGGDRVGALDRPVCVELPALCIAGTLPETIQTLQRAPCGRLAERAAASRCRRRFVFRSAV